MRVLVLFLFGTLVWSLCQGHEIILSDKVWSETYPMHHEMVTRTCDAVLLKPNWNFKYRYPNEGIIKRTKEEEKLFVFVHLSAIKTDIGMENVASLIYQYIVSGAFSRDDKLIFGYGPLIAEDKTEAVKITEMNMYESCLLFKNPKATKKLQQNFAPIYNSRFTSMELLKIMLAMVYKKSLMHPIKPWSQHLVVFSNSSGDAKIWNNTLTLSSEKTPLNFEKTPLSSEKNFCPLCTEHPLEVKFYDEKGKVNVESLSAPIDCMINHENVERFRNASSTKTTLIKIRSTDLPCKSMPSLVITTAAYISLLKFESVSLFEVISSAPNNLKKDEYLRKHIGNNIQENAPNDIQENTPNTLTSSSSHTPSNMPSIIPPDMPFIHECVSPDYIPVTEYGHYLKFRTAKDPLGLVFNSECDPKDGIYEDCRSLIHYIRDISTKSLASALRKEDKNGALAIFRFPVLASYDSKYSVAKSPDFYYQIIRSVLKASTENSEKATYTNYYESNTKNQKMFRTSWINECYGIYIWHKAPLCSNGNTIDWNRNRYIKLPAFGVLSFNETIAMVVISTLAVLTCIAYILLTALLIKRRRKNN